MPTDAPTITLIPRANSRNKTSLAKLSNSTVLSSSERKNAHREAGSPIGFKMAQDPNYLNGLTKDEVRKELHFGEGANGLSMLGTGLAANRNLMKVVKEKGLEGELRKWIRENTGNFFSEGVAKRADYDLKRTDIEIVLGEKNLIKGKNKEYAHIPGYHGRYSNYARGVMANPGYQTALHVVQKEQKSSGIIGFLRGLFGR